MNEFISMKKIPLIFFIFFFNLDTLKLLSQTSAYFMSLNLGCSQGGTNENFQEIHTNLLF